MWEIIDDISVIHSGTKPEMLYAFDVISNPDNYSDEEIIKWDTSWHGDLKLIQVVNIYK